MENPSFEAVAKVILDLTPEQQKLLVQNSDKLKKFLGELESQKLFPITVDRTISRAEQIKAGSYDWTNSDINDQNFPVGRSEITDTKVSCKLLGFDKVLTGHQILERIKQDPTIRPATPSETLAFGAQHPEEQRKHFIVGLGPDNRSRWRDGVSWRVPCLYESADGRRLLLHWLVFRFGTDFWFLVVCK